MLEGPGLIIPLELSSVHVSRLFGHGEFIIELKSLEVGSKSLCFFGIGRYSSASRLCVKLCIELNFREDTAVTGVLLLLLLLHGVSIELIGVLYTLAAKWLCLTARVCRVNAPRECLFVEQPSQKESPQSKQSYPPESSLQMLHM